MRKRLKQGRGVKVRRLIRFVAKTTVKLFLVLGASGCLIPVIAQAVNDQQVEQNFKNEKVNEPLPILDFNQNLEGAELDTYTKSAHSQGSSRMLPLPLLAEEPDSMYQHHLRQLGLTDEEAFPNGVYPFNFGQFLIGQLTLAEYNNIWHTVRENNLQNRSCKIHYRDHTFIATGVKCISYFNYVEAHADEKGMLESISISGNQPGEQNDSSMLDFLNKRYRPLAYERMPQALQEVADLRMDLCNDLRKLMDGNYKCTDHWFYYRNFFMVFSPSTYQDHRKEQFTYGTLHHFVDYERMMVKRRLAIVRQELNAKTQEHTVKRTSFRSKSVEE